MTIVPRNAKLLLIDTCGETAGVALCEGPTVVVRKNLSRGGASAEIVSVVRSLLTQVGCGLANLYAVGVVNGPGSFTGMRTGLAAAKGLCEAGGLRLVAVSRLEVLKDAGGVSAGQVALDAGRGEVYVRDVRSGREWLSADAEVRNEAGLVVAEERVAERLSLQGPTLRPLDVADALRTVLRVLEAGVDATDSRIDANYVRGESDIYRRTGQPAMAASRP